MSRINKKFTTIQGKLTQKGISLYPFVKTIFGRNPFVMTILAAVPPLKSLNTMEFTPEQGGTPGLSSYCPSVQDDSTVPPAKETIAQLMEFASFCSIVHNFAWQVRPIYSVANKLAPAGFMS